MSESEIPPNERWLHEPKAKAELEAALEDALEAQKEMALRGKECPECRSAAYYWLKSSGRCADCGFHWGIDK